MTSSITFAAESGRRLRVSAYLTFVASGVAGLLVNTATLLFAAEILLLPVWLGKAGAIFASFFVYISRCRTLSSSGRGIENDAALHPRRTCRRHRDCS